MRVIVVETPDYRENSKRLLSEQERRDLRAHLAENPMDSDVIPGMGGLRKARWSQQSRNKGKRGGVRVIYLYAISKQTIALLDMYSKEEKDDLTDADKKRLRATLEEIKSFLAEAQPSG